MRSLVTSAVLAVSVFGCMMSASRDQLARRSSFDLACPAEQTRYVQVDERSWGATGCGRRAVYVESCDGVTTSPNTKCTWVLNGSVVQEAVVAAPPAPAPAAATATATATAPASVVDDETPPVRTP
jgi:hypothetical protein